MNSLPSHSLLFSVGKGFARLLFARRTPVKEEGGGGRRRATRSRHVRAINDATRLDLLSDRKPHTYVIRFL